MDRMMKTLVAAMIIPGALIAADSSRTPVSIDITEGWRWQPVATKGVTDKSKVIGLPEETDLLELEPSKADIWLEKGKLAGKPGRERGEPGGDNEKAAYACWYKRTLDVPKEWAGHSVRFEQQLNWCAAVVFVNGKEAGVALHPDGAVELAPFLKFGKKNEIKILKAEIERLEKEAQ